MRASNGLRGLYPASEYPSRDTALALADALTGDAWTTVTELERLAGVDDFGTIAERCWMVYGLPALDPVTRARRISEVSMRPKASFSSRDEKVQQRPPATEISAPPPQDGFGFQRRA